MRAFVSVEAPDPRRPGDPSGVSHLTLRFLGEVAEALVPTLSDRLREATRGVPPFGFELRGTGAFPDPERPRVVFAKVVAGADRLGELAARVERATREVGLPAEGRPFVPHVTILRVRGPRDLGEARRALAEDVDRSFGRREVREVLLNASELRPSGAVHTVLARFPLDGTPGG